MKKVKTVVTHRYFCDLCGFESARAPGISGWASAQMPRGKQRRSTVDLCPTCTQAFEEWLTASKQTEAPAEPLPKPGAA